MISIDSIKLDETNGFIHQDSIILEDQDDDEPQTPMKEPLSGIKQFNSERGNRKIDSNSIKVKLNFDSNTMRDFKAQIRISKEFTFKNEGMEEQKNAECFSEVSNMTFNPHQNSLTIDSDLKIPKTPKEF